MNEENKLFSQIEEMTVQSMVNSINQYLQKQWKSVLQMNQNKLSVKFDEIGEATYGIYLKKLMTPIIDEMTSAGFILNPGFVLPNSIEHWGPPEERERCMWCVIKNKDQTPIGTLVVRVFHSHTKFDIPLAPNFFALEETDKDAIIEMISNASIRLNKKFGGVVHRDIKDESIQRWEYSAETGLSDYLNSNQDAVEVSALDHALSRWGKQGWELTSVVPHDDRLIAFFKRPKKIN